jgi:anionic cell wall polymer biosynthesis LytR-Cps2A-Psr (LCP) family protein
MAAQPKTAARALSFLPGSQILNGEEALTLARIRNEGVFERASHQNTVMCALQEKLTSPSVVVRIPAVNSFQGAVQTDLTPEQFHPTGLPRHETDRRRHHLCQLP